MTSALPMQFMHAVQQPHQNPQQQRLHCPEYQLANIGYWK